MTESDIHTPPEQPSPTQTETPSPPEWESLSQELDSLRTDVARFNGYREGCTAVAWLVGTIVAIVIAALGWLGISGTIQRSVDANVQQRLEEQLTQVMSDIEARIQQANDAVARAENSAGRADNSAQNAASSLATSQALQASFLLAATQASASQGVGEWIVGFASPSSLDDAIDQASLAIQAGYSVDIYHIGEYYVPAIGIFPSQNEATTASLAIRSSFARSTALYNLSISCPYRQHSESGFYACSLLPFPTCPPPP
jgi:hypothetical protein